MEASGDKSKINIRGGSDLCRIAFWQRVFTRIEPKRSRLNNEIGAALGLQLDAFKSSGVSGSISAYKASAQRLQSYYSGNWSKRRSE
ncbi:hypothetical protein [Tolypothrix sp. VBCCA 56010]|uniref:hypothetical protein n=1 Tax=Tolypothrix sp. VBCCA 56010 TaxID=3137731 RepID=UPI003D7E5432